MKAAITGATGFLGSNLWRDLVRRGCEVSGLIHDSGRTDALPAAIQALAR